MASISNSFAVSRITLLYVCVCVICVSPVKLHTPNRIFATANVLGVGDFFKSSVGIEIEEPFPRSHNQVYFSAMSVEQGIFCGMTPCMTRMAENTKPAGASLYVCECGGRVRESMRLLEKNKKFHLK